ncbi:zinc finger CCHC domain-containing protein 10 isoform X1 [Neodiprion virginianus]|uniref:zinc finger CCHC domain-containing protein 10 isoform X1 n=2 Tax=Neodiprion virginianus TaxID=2961670 RepID=UPI001EE6A65C|nr:zinc finger CCHC domain-containing protein 10 isoform X1 [Neodiprion virginianus]XP_046618167.1 zinc finger CCHC domain-containing protein 10 isoform X1 [Neodiprion virginianus]
MSAYGMKLMKKTYPYPASVRCQKCLEMGHWSYECKGKRKYVHRSSRTTQLKKAIKQQEVEKLEPEMTSETVKQKKKIRKESSSTSDSDSSSTDSSSSDSSSSDDSDSSDSSSSSSSSSGSSGSTSSSSSSRDSSSSEGTKSSKAKKTKKCKFKLVHTFKLVPTPVVT